MDPALYALHHHTYTEDLPFWRWLARQAQGPVLELGCGTGRVYLPLLEEGIALWGVDRQAAMLRYLRDQAAPEQRTRLRLIQADMRALGFAPGAFALVLVPCNTFSLLDAPARAQVLAAVARLLRPGGCLALSLPNPLRLASLPPEGESEPEGLFWHPESGHPVQVSSAWHYEPGRWSVMWHYDHLWPDGMVERTTVRQIHHLIPPDEQRQAFAGFGLTVEAQYGDFDRSPWQAQAPYLIWVLRRLSPTEPEEAP